MHLLEVIWKLQYISHFKQQHENFIMDLAIDQTVQLADKAEEFKLINFLFSSSVCIAIKKKKDTNKGKGFAYLKICFSHFTKMYSF